MKKGLCVILPLALFSLAIKAKNTAQIYRSEKFPTTSSKPFLFSAYNLTDNVLYQSLDYSGNFSKHVPSTTLNP